MELDYRLGKKEDSGRIAQLDYLASGGAAEYLFHDLVENVSPVELIASSLENDEYPHSYRSAIVVEHNNEIIGMSLSFPAKYHTITDELRNFLPVDRLEHFKHFFSTRVEGSYFLDALCVDERYRNNGIGSKLIELTKRKAKDEGFDILSLIVFADNREARQLYEREGFENVRNIELQPLELVPHEGGCILMKAAT